MSYIQSLINNISIESDEVSIPPVSEGVDEIELLEFSVESLQHTLTHTLGVMVTLNALSEQYANGTLSVESYQQQVGVFFQASGFDIDPRLITPSFEAEDKSAEKKKNVFLRIVDYILAKLKQFYEYMFIKKDKDVAAIKTDIEHYKSAKMAVKDRKSSSEPDNKKDDKSPTVDEKSDKPARTGFYISKTCVENEKFSLSAFEKTYNHILQLDKTLQGYDYNTANLADVQQTTSDIAAYVVVVKDKALVHMTLDEVNALDLAKLDKLVETDIYGTIEKYAKVLDGSMLAKKKELEREMKSLQTRINAGEDVKKDLDTAQRKFNILALQTKQSSLLSCLGVLVKDATKVLNSVK